MKTPRILCSLSLIGGAAEIQAAAPTRGGLWVMQKLPPDAATRAESHSQDHAAEAKQLGCEAYKKSSSPKKYRH